MIWAGDAGTRFYPLPLSQTNDYNALCFRWNDSRSSVSVTQVFFY